MELQKLWVTLQLRASEFGAGLDEARQRVEGFAGRLRSGLGGALGTVASLGRTAFLGVGAAAVGGFGVAMNAAIDMNASLERSTLQFTTLMGDADKATEHVGNLFEFAAKTPYESQQIIDASLKLQTFGGAALNTMENLTLVGDAAAAVNAPIDEVSFWVGRLYSNLQGGQPFGEAAMRLQELGIMTPQARTELEAMQAAGAGANDMFAVFQGQLGAFTGAMELQAGTWGGLMSTIKDNLAMAAAEGLRPFFDAAKSGLEGLAAWLSSPEVQTGIQTVAQGFATLIQNVAAFVTEHVVPFVQEHGPLLKNLIIGLGTAFAALTIISTVVGWIGGLIGVVTAAGAAFTAAGGGIAGIIAILGGPLTLVIGAVVGAITLLTLAWKNNWGGIQEKTAAVWSVIQPLLQAAWDWLKVHVPAALEALRAFWVDKVWPAIQNIVAAVWPVVQAIFQAIKAFIADVLIPAVQALYAKWVESVWPAVQRVVETVWPIVRAVFAAIGDFIKDTLIPAIQALYTSWVEDAWPALRTVVEVVWRIVRAIFEELGRWINDNIVPWVEFLYEKWVTDVWPAIQTAVETAWEIIEPIWDAVREWLADTLPPIINALQTTFENVMAGISAAVQPVKDVWDGFVGAVQGFWDWIKNKVFNFQINLPNLPSWAVPGSPLPIHTAWMAFAEEMAGIGRRIADGLVAAFAGMPDAAEALDGLFEVMGRVSGLGGGFGGFFQRRTLDPLKEELEGFDTAIQDTVELLRDVLPEGFDQMEHGAKQLLLQRLAGTGFLAETAEEARARVFLALMEERGRINLEYIQQQERLAKLEEQQTQISFLQQQLDLIKLIKDNALDASILEGLQLGLGADAGALMDAMVAAMRQMIAAAEDELGIHSPSRWAVDTMRNVFGAMVGTAERESAALKRSLGRALEPALALAIPGVSGGTVDNSRRAVNYGGYHVHVQSGDGQTALETLWEMGLR